MPASMCPAAILFAMINALSSDVPHARAVVMPGVVGASPDDSVASRARFQSKLCLITAPNATSPSSTPYNPKRSTSAPSVLTAMPKLPTSAYAVLLRQNGMRTPPRIATRGVPVCIVFNLRGRSIRCFAPLLLVGAPQFEEPGAEHRNFRATRVVRQHIQHRRGRQTF